MPEEIVDDVEVVEEPAEPDSDAASQTDNELPDDPEELKSRLKASETAKADAQREAARAKRKNERLEESVKEERRGKEHWYKEATRQQSEKLEADTRTNGKQPKRDDPDDDEFRDLKGGLADGVVDDEDGKRKLAKDLKKSGFVTERDINRIVEERLNKRDEQNRRATNLFGSLTARFPDLNDLDSELAQETTERAKRLIEDEGMQAPEAYRIAAAEAALDLGVKPKEKAKREPAPTNGNRLRNAQGGPVGRSNAEPAKIVIPEARIQEAMKMGLTRERATAAQTKLEKQRRQFESSQSRRA